MCKLIVIIITRWWWLWRSSVIVSSRRRSLIFGLWPGSRDNPPQANNKSGTESKLINGRIAVVARAAAVSEIPEIESAIIYRRQELSFEPDAKSRADINVGSCFKTPGEFRVAGVINRVRRKNSGSK